MNTKKKHNADVLKSDHNGNHPSEEELQEWELFPDSFASQEFERIREHLDRCRPCKVYCERVRMAEKDVEAYLETENGRNARQILLDQIASKCASDCPCQGPRDNGKLKSCVPDDPPPDSPHMYGRRKTHARLEKLAIGRCIAEILAQGSYVGEAMGADGGTTNEALAEVLGHDAATSARDQRVLITNHRLIPQLISRHSDRIQVLGVGGLYRADRETFVGDQAIESIQRLQYSVSVLGINGFSPPWLLTGSGVEDGIKKAFIRSSRDVILAFDSSKWGFNSGSRLATLADLFGTDYLLEPDGRTVHLVTTYPVVDPEVCGAEHAKVLRYRDRFLAGVKRLTTNGWREYDSSVRAAIVRFRDEDTLDLMLDLKEPHRLDSLPERYFDDLELEREENLDSVAHSVLVVSIELIGDFVNSRRPVDKLRTETGKLDLVGVSAHDTDCRG